MRHTHISAESSVFALDLKELWQYRDLISLFTARRFKVSYKQTVLGPAWIFLNPLITSLYQLILFGNIIRLSTDNVPQILFYMSGNALWGFFAGCLNGSAGTFSSNAYLFGKVYFPRLVMPISDFFSGVIRFGLQMILFALLYLYFFIKGMVRPTLYLLLIPLILAILGLLGMGVGMIISSLTTKYRDLSIFLGFGMQIWMYATPIVYPFSEVNGKIRTLVALNPVTSMSELFRYALFGVGFVTAESIISTLIFTVFSVIIGLLLFGKIERTFVDTI